MNKMPFIVRIEKKYNAFSLLEAIICQGSCKGVQLQTRQQQHQHCHQVDMHSRYCDQLKEVFGKAPWLLSSLNP